MLDTLCSKVVWRVLATHSIRQFPLHFPSRASPCAITFQLDCTANINAYFQDNGLRGCFAGFRTCHPAKQKHCGTPVFHTCCFSNWTRLDDRGGLYLYWNSEIVRWCTLCTRSTLNISTFRTLIIVQLAFVNFNYKKEMLNFFACLQATVRPPTSESHRYKQAIPTHPKTTLPRREIHIQFVWVSSFLSV